MEDRGTDATVAIISDIHYAGLEERARGEDYEFQAIANPFLRRLARAYRHNVWMRHPFSQAKQLERFLARDIGADLLIANGDYSCDTAFLGLSDPAAFQSASECVHLLRARFGERVLFTLGDHEFGKLTLFGGKGGMRLAGWHRATVDLGLKAFWKRSVGRYALMGVASSLIALPAQEADVLPEELPEWRRLREAHLAEIRAGFDSLRPEERVLLFCHDPTALPFLAREESVRRRLPQIEQTIIGHLHTRLILWKSRVLSGIPAIRFLGRNVSRFSSALHAARHWWPFRVRLCPALSGIELLNDGGYYTAHIDPAAARPARFAFHPLPR